MARYRSARRWRPPGRRAHRLDLPVGYRSGTADRRTGSVSRFIEHPSPARPPGPCLATAHDASRSARAGQSRFPAALRQGGHGGGDPGARWDLRLFVYALLHLDVADRDGEWHTIRLLAAPEHAARIYETTGKRLPSVEDWLHPNGWANKRRDWHKLPAALDRMRRLAYVPVPGIGRVAVLFPSVIPSAPSDSLIEWTIRIPRVAAHGDRLNWPRLLDYGTESDRLFRAYLAVAAWLGRSANHGHPITRQIAAPVLGPGGKPRRRKGGAIIRSATERTDNPARRSGGRPGPAGIGERLERSAGH